MRILIAHNHYQQLGGEDAVVKSEYDLLRTKGEDVFLYERDNKEILAYPFGKRLRFLRDLSCERESYDSFLKCLKEFRPDIVHFHNIFFVLSPAVYRACRDLKVPVVQSQHNFRLVCANGLFFRDNKICEECLTGSLWKGVLHRCFKDSRLITACVVRMLSRHWRKNTWKELVDLYIVGSEFPRQKYVQAGIPAEKIVVKPNFVSPTPEFQGKDEGYALYVGRLSPEKGVEGLLRAWEKVPEFPLKIVGDGPLAPSLKDFAAQRNIRNVEFLGFVDKKAFERQMSGARFLIVPSLCYENFPRVLAEAFSYGTPVLAVRLGSLSEIVQERQNGLLFHPGGTEDLVEKARWMTTHQEEMSAMRITTRKIFEEKYTAEENYRQLMAVYGRAKALAQERFSRKGIL